MSVTDAPAVVEFGTDDKAPLPVPPPTFYCCGRCRSSTCCCGSYARPCTPRLRRWTIALVVFYVLAGLAGLACGIYFGLYYHPGQPVRITSLVGAPSATATALRSAGRKLLQSSPSSPASATQSATATAYAQARGRSVSHAVNT